MTKTELSIFMYGLYYIFSIGMPFLLFPHYALGLFGLEAGDDVWIRVLGLMVIIIGAFYIAAVRAGLTPFYPWTIAPRFESSALQILVVALGMAGPALLMFAGFDALTAGLTLWALKAEAAEATA